MGLTLSPQKKGLPKLTVSQIPLEVLEMECGSSLSITDGDYMTKKTLISLILEKSADHREMSQLGHTMEVIYMNKSAKYMNIGHRVSPTVRNWVLHRGYVYWQFMLSCRRQNLYQAMLSLSKNWTPGQRLC